MPIHQDAKPGRHSQRVAAWIYTIINPIIDALRSEAEILERGNLTWRYHSKRFEHIRPIREYIDPHYVPNFEDFLADNSEFAAKFASHDVAVVAAEERALKFYEVIVASPVFIEQVKKTTQEYESPAQPPPAYDPGVALMGDDLPKEIAAHLINSTDVLPPHYTIHKFWELFGQEFRSHIPDFESQGDGKSFNALRQAVGKLKTASTTLKGELEKHRLYLCREFDLPAAQPVTSGRSATDMFQLGF